MPAFRPAAFPLSAEVLNVLKLPVAASRVRVWGRGGREVWCHAEVKHATEYTVLADIHVYNEHGLLLAGILGFRLQRAAGAGSTVVQPGLKAYTTHWKPSPLERRDVPQQRVPSVWIIFADSGGIANDIASRLSNRGARVLRISSGAEFDLRGVESLAAEGVKVGVLYFRSLDVSEGPEAAERFAGDAMLSVIGPLSVMRAVAALKHVVVAKFALVTKNARKVFPYEKPGRTNATGTLGLGRVAANEFPAWPIKLVDLTERPKAEDLDGLSSELLSDDAETESAWRDGERFVPRLEEGPTTDVCSVRPSEVAAFRLVCQNSGSFDALKWIPRQRLTPGPGQVELQVQHAAINFRDLLKCLGVYPADHPEELALGDECAGAITATGSGVTEFQVGDRVACCVPGSFQSHVVAPAAALFRISPDWSTSDAATIPIAFLTAWYSLRTVGRLAPGESVLIHSATGGVGMAAVQVARAAGARIFATAGTTEKRRSLLIWAANWLMDSRSLTFSDEIRDHTNGRGVDVILNSLAGGALLKGVSILAPYGRLLEQSASATCSEIPDSGCAPLRLNASFHAIDLGAVLQEKPSLAEPLFMEVRSAFQAGMLRPLPCTTWPASKVSDAFQYDEPGQAHREAGHRYLRLRVADHQQRRYQDILSRGWNVCRHRRSQWFRTGNRQVELRGVEDGT